MGELGSAPPHPPARPTPPALKTPGAGQGKWPLAAGPSQAAAGPAVNPPLGGLQLGIGASRIALAASPGVGWARGWGGYHNHPLPHSAATPQPLRREITRGDGAAVRSAEGAGPE